MTGPHSGPPARRQRRTEVDSRHRVRRGTTTAAIVFTVISIVAAPSAVADTSANLRDAVAAVHGRSCGPLRPDPMVDQAAEKINETTDKYIDHAARFVPETDALPILKDLGYGGTKAAILSGASSVDADAIKGILLQGWAKIPDCSYTDFGVSTLYNETKGLTLLTVVLAG